MASARVTNYKYVAADPFGMAPSPDDAAATDGGATDDRVSVSVTIEDGETVITMSGDRDTAVVVRSDSGERIYLPPEDFDRDGSSRSARPDTPYEGLGTDSPYQSAPTDSPYQPAPTDSPYQRAENDSSQAARSDSPYQGTGSDSPYQGTDSDSPYQAAGETTQSTGLSATADGYRIRHPEPVLDVRVLR